ATVFITGLSQDSTSSADYATLALDSATGARQWVMRYNGTGSSDDLPRAMAVSPDGSTVFVTGASMGPASDYDYATVAYDAVTGAARWVKRYNGPGNSAGAAHTLAVSPDGSQVFV